METQTTSSTLTENKIITSTADGIRTIKTIFDWEANWPEHWDETKRHSYSHCLLRICVNVKANRAAVIASELYSNEPNIGISVDFEGLVKAVVKEFRSFISIPLSQVIWIQHYGRFGTPRSYENLNNRDSFYQIKLPGLGKEITGELEETYLLSTQVQELIGWTDIEPVEKVLLELDAASLSEWTAVYVEETQAL